MRKLPMLLALACGLLLLASCSDDDPAGPGGGDPRPGFSLAGLDLGPLDSAETGGFRLVSAAEPLLREAAQVADHGDARVLKDPDNANDLPALITVTAASQRLFTFDALDAADLAGTVGTQPASGITVRGFLMGEPVRVNAVDYYGPPALDLRTYPAQTLAGYLLDRLEVEIASTGGAAGDDLAVGYLELAASDAALVVFGTLPSGEFEHLFLGEFELTWPGVVDRPEVAEAPDGLHVLTDPARDELVDAVVVLERADGGMFRFDGLYASDLDDVDPGDTHNDSLLRLEGFDGAVSAGSDTFTPTGRARTRFDADQLQGVELTSLRLTVRSVCGVFKCDDLAVGGILLTLVD